MATYDHQNTFIIILTWNALDATLRCLNSLVSGGVDESQIILVDNASSDDTIAKIESKFPLVKLIKQEKNTGFSAGVNTGIKLAEKFGAGNVLILNNDTVLSENPIPVMVEYIQDLPEAGIVAPHIYESGIEEKIWYSGGDRHTLTGDPLGFKPGKVSKRDSPDIVKEVDYVFGTAMLIKMDVIKNIGLLNEDFFLYYEDLEFCNRARAAHYKIYSIPEIKIQHEISASTRRNREFRIYHKARSSVIYYLNRSNSRKHLIITLPYRFFSAIKFDFVCLANGKRDLIISQHRGFADGIRFIRHRPEKGLFEPKF
jgi:GT2 family glycosyltransferase